MNIKHQVMNNEKLASTQHKKRFIMWLFILCFTHTSLLKSLSVQVKILNTTSPISILKTNYQTLPNVNFVASRYYKRLFRFTKSGKMGLELSKKYNYNSVKMELEIELKSNQYFTNSETLDSNHAIASIRQSIKRIENFGGIVPFKGVRRKGPLLFTVFGIKSIENTIELLASSFCPIYLNKLASITDKKTWHSFEHQIASWDKEKIEIISKINSSKTVIYFNTNIKTNYNVQSTLLSDHKKGSGKLRDVHVQDSISISYLHLSNVNQSTKNCIDLLLANTVYPNKSFFDQKIHHIPFIKSPDSAYIDLNRSNQKTLKKNILVYLPSSIRASSILKKTFKNKLCGVRFHFATKSEMKNCDNCPKMYLNYLTIQNPSNQNILNAMCKIVGNCPRGNSVSLAKITHIENRTIAIAKGRNIEQRL